MDKFPKTPDEWSSQYGHVDFVPELGLIVPNRESLKARRMDDPHSPVAIITAWTPISKFDELPLDYFDVMSSCYQQKLGAELVLWGLLTRPWIKHLFVVGSNIGDIPSGADVILTLASIKDQLQPLIDSEDWEGYKSQFLALLQQAQQQHAIPANFASTFLDLLPQAMAGIDVNAQYWRQKVDVPTLQEHLQALQSDFPVVSRLPIFAPLPIVEAGVPMPVEPGPLRVTRLDSGDLPGVWREILKLISMYRFEVQGGKMQQISTSIVIPWEDIANWNDKYIEKLGMSKERMQEYLRLMIAPDLLDRPELVVIGAADYFYGERIFGIDFFPEAWQKIVAGNLDKSDPVVAWILKQHQTLSEDSLPTHPKNQFKAAVDEFVENRSSRRAVIGLYDSRRDTSAINPPCVTNIQFLETAAGRVDMKVVIRSQDMLKAWPSNTAGLMKLLGYFIAEVNRKGGLDLNPGNLILDTESAHFYTSDMAEVTQLISEFNTRPFQLDPRGNFMVEYRQGEIIVKFQSGDLLINVDSREMKNKSLQEISNQITRVVNEAVKRQLLVNDPDHVRYLVNTIWMEVVANLFTPIS